MGDEPRRSGRATKGQHTKVTEAEPEAAKSTKAKPARSTKKTSNNTTTDTEDEEESVDAIIRCICGTTTEEEDDEEERMMICCDQCTCWQHNECMEVSLDEDSLPETYLCEICSPEDHKGLLEKIEKGEKPWEERAREREANKKGRKKGGKTGKGGTKSRPSDASEEVNGKNEAQDQQVSSADTDAGNVQTPKGKGQSLEPMGPPGTKPGSGKRKLRGEAEDAVIEVDKAPEPKVRKVTPAAPDKKPPARRDSSTSTKVPASPTEQTARTPTQTEFVPGLESLENGIRKKTASVLLNSFSEQIPAAQKAGSYALPKGQTVDSVALRLALDVEHAVFINHSNHPGDPSNAYRARIRSMVFNLKKNPALRDRLLQNNLSPDEFSTMSTDDMASEDMQQRTAEMKREAEKQHILIKEEGPRIRRTHKGDELVDDNRGDGGGNESIFTSAPARRRESIRETESPKAASPPTSVHSPRSPEAMSETAEDGGAGSPVTAMPLKVDTKAAPRVGGPERTPSTSTFNIQDVWSSVHSPHVESQRPSQPTTSRQQQIRPPPPENTRGAGIDSEIDQLLNDDNESPPYSPTDHEADPLIIWRGKLFMPGVAEFSASAKHVGGADLDGKIGWSNLIPQAMRIDGRIGIDRASEYLCGLRWSKTTDVVVIALTPSGGMDSQIEFEKLWAYFNDRQKYGVVGTSDTSAYRDAYVIPLEAGMAKIPEFMEILEHNLIEAPRRERMMLLSFTVKANNSSTPGMATPAPAAQQSDPVSTYPIGPLASLGGSPVANATSGSPGVASAFNSHSSVGQAQFAQSASQQLPYQAAPQLTPQAPAPSPLLSSDPTQAAAQILGSLVDAPVVKQVLAQGDDLSAKQLGIIKGILQRVPAAGADFDMFGKLLAAEWQS